MKRMMKNAQDGCVVPKKWLCCYWLEKGEAKVRMKIERLQIHGFGRIKEQEILFNAPITVLAGPNEAGKSTILQFVRAMLYGIPSRAYPSERYEPPGGGRHGGVLTAKAADGSKWTITRYTASDQRTGAGRSEQLSIVKTDMQGTAVHMTQNDLERELLGGLSRDMFKQLFAVTLTELQEIRTLQSEEMGSYLFHAGFGGGGEIMRAERKLIQDMDKLYKPRGRVQESAKVLHAMEQLQREISESRSYLSKFMDAESKLQEIQHRISETDQCRTAISSQLVVLHKALQIRPQWLEWREASAERDGLPGSISFPEEGIQRWERLRDEQDRILLRLQGLERASEEWNKQLDLIQTDEQLIRQGPHIERLANRREYVEMRMKEHQEFSGEKAAVAQQLQRLLRQIHSGWTRSELRAFSGAVSEREAVRLYAAGFAGYDRRMEGLAFEREQKSRQLESAEYELRRTEVILKERKDTGISRFVMIIPQTKSELLTVWNDIQSEAERWRETRLDRLSLKGLEEREAVVSGRMKALYRKLLWGSAAVTMILPAILWLLQSAWGALFAFLIFIIVDVMLWRGGSASTVNSRSRRQKERFIHDPADEEDRLSSLMTSLISDPLTASAAASGQRRYAFSEQDVEFSLRELRKLVDAWLLWQDELERSKSEVAGARQRVETLQHEVSAVTRKMDGEQGIFEQLDREWQLWLTERRLEAGTSPETVMDMFGFAEQGMELVRRLDALEHKQQTLEQEIEAFEKECRMILAVDEEVRGIRILSQLENRKAAWAEQQQHIREKEAIHSKLEPVKEEIFKLSREMNQIAKAVQSLLDEGQADDDEAFLRLGAVSERVQELNRSIRHLEVSMFSGWSAERVQALLDILNHHDAAALDKACREAEKESEKAEKQWNELQLQQGRLLQERDQLVRLCSHDTALQQLEEQKASLKEIAAEYAVLSICAEMITRTRSIYEKEKQPQVLKLASTYFQELTGGSYNRIVMKIGEKKLLAEHRDAGLIDSSLLSRGTAEQLYLCMRFALAGSMKSKAVVPMLFDDLFVNFDEDRMCSALNLAGSLAADRQIIMLTCHRYVVDHIQARIPQAEIIRI
ncbi:AAA family ATPase [Paenibacillus dokdonensis]|uniref:AAA family ATPase n=2 Tax=Paenibacillus dokdonensis TaxID=2567944 RepID=A0ABU6GIZ8_9BACL|nr:AAA family ATPase [Paenibacillus dokdonensis]MEC0239082.1 AAA family ATPase [Paenibacillus dokdonensis]